VAPQLLPHAPQFLLSVRASTHCPPHNFWAFEQLQLPFTHVCRAPQLLPQAPQFSASSSNDTQRSLQACSATPASAQAQSAPLHWLPRLLPPAPAELGCGASALAHPNADSSSKAQSARRFRRSGVEERETTLYALFRILARSARKNVVSLCCVQCRSWLRGRARVREPAARTRCSAELQAAVHRSRTWALCASW
jgi:hypothetical protein